MSITKRKALIQAHLRQAQKKAAEQRTVQRVKVRLPFKAEHLDEAKLRQAVERLPA